MSMIETTDQLAALCARLAEEPFVTVDTEFLRDKTYWPQLCLVQLASRREAVAIDPLAPGIDLDPLFALMANPAVLKVFHAARQDVEIFVQMAGAVPAPLFDTQVAAMVCGFGDAASYETLAGKLAGARIDKSSRFTDWSNRPLTDRQVEYALADVTHLRVVYDKLSQRLAKSGRADWLAEEMAVLTNAATYRLDPDQAWTRLKPRGGTPQFLNVLRAVAAWRETEAQKRNLPRTRLIRDESILELASQTPTTVEDLARSRSITRGQAEGALGQSLLAAVKRGLEQPTSEAPRLADRLEVPSGRAALIELLKVLLKANCERHQVAQRLVAVSSDLDLIACQEHPDVPAMRGWRYEIFGADAQSLKRGELALTVDRDQIRVVKLAEVAISP